MTDVGATKRKAMTPARRLRIFEDHKGLCVLCGVKIDGVRESWIVEHLICLGLGAKDEDANCGPAHEACRRDKDKLDVRAIAKAKRVKQRHLNIKAAPAKPIQSAGFSKAAKPERAGKTDLPPLPRNQLYRATGERT